MLVEVADQDLDDGRVVFGEVDGALVGFLEYPVSMILLLELVAGFPYFERSTQ